MSAPRAERVDQSPALDVVALDALVRAAFPADEAVISVAGELEKPWARVWSVAPDAGVLVAWHVADELHVLSVAVSPSGRRRGTGLALMDALIAYAREQAVRLILLEVRRSNAAAIGLYRKLGFTVFNVRRGYYSNDGEDALELSLTLDPASGAILPGEDEPGAG